MLRKYKWGALLGLTLICVLVFFINPSRKNSLFLPASVSFELRPQTCGNNFIPYTLSPWIIKDLIRRDDYANIIFKGIDRDAVQIAIQIFNNDVSLVTVRALDRDMAVKQGRNILTLFYRKDINPNIIDNKPHSAEDCVPKPYIFTSNDSLGLDSIYSIFRDQTRGTSDSVDFPKSDTSRK